MNKSVKKVFNKVFGGSLIPIFILVLLVITIAYFGLKRLKDSTFSIIVRLYGCLLVGIKYSL